MADLIGYYVVEPVTDVPGGYFLYIPMAAVGLAGQYDEFVPGRTGAKISSPRFSLKWDIVEMTNSRFIHGFILQNTVIHHRPGRAT